MQDDFEKNKTETGNNSEDKYNYPVKIVSDSTENFQADDMFENSASGDEISKAANSEKRTKNLLVTAVVVLVCLIIALVGYIVYYIRGGSEVTFGANTAQSKKEVNSEFAGESAIKTEPEPADSRELSAESVYEIMAPSVVGVVVYDSHADIISDPVSEGSGIIINEKGYIVTNSHVVKNSKQNNIKIVLNSGEEFSGKIIGYDTKTDIAVIKIDKTGLKAAVFGNSDEVKVGSPALALGNPLGLDFASSLTRGIVSAVNRCADGGSKSLVKYIQTDAAINPGNSGGPLINMYGQVIGINSSKIAVAHCEGMGFAIPANTAKSVVDDIISKGYVSGRVRLGLSGKMVSNYQAQIYNVPMGVIVSEISSDSNLTAAGVRTGDIITKINNINVTSLNVFYGELYNHKAGENITLSIYRTSSGRMDSQSFDVTVTLLEDKGETQNIQSNQNEQ